MTGEHSVGVTHPGLMSTTSQQNWDGNIRRVKRVTDRMVDDGSHVTLPALVGLGSNGIASNVMSKPLTAAA